MTCHREIPAMKIRLAWMLMAALFLWTGALASQEVSPQNGGLREVELAIAGMT